MLACNEKLSFVPQAALPSLRDGRGNAVDGGLGALAERENQLVSVMVLGTRGERNGKC